MQLVAREIAGEGEGENSLAAGDCITVVDLEDLITNGIETTSKSDTKAHLGRSPFHISSPSCLSYLSTRFRFE
jgi:hypothetical protein